MQMSSKRRPHLMHDSSEILYIRNSCYMQEVEHVRQHFQQQYQNWIQLDVSKNKWSIWSSIRKEVSSTMKHIHSYLERTGSSKYKRQTLNALLAFKLSFKPIFKNYQELHYPPHAI